MEFNWIHYAIAAAVAGIAVGATYVFKLKPDNPIEKVAEEVIKEETGVTVNLSPQDKDKK